MTSTQYKYGDIILVGPEPVSGSEKRGKAKLAVIVSADAINENLQTVIICPIIKANQVSTSRIGATFIPQEIGNLGNNSLILSFQINTISKERILKRIDSLPASFMLQVKESLQAVLNMD